MKKVLFVLFLVWLVGISLVVYGLNKIYDPLGYIFLGGYLVNATGGVRLFKKERG